MKLQVRLILYVSIPIHVQIKFYIKLNISSVCVLYTSVFLSVTNVNTWTDMIKSVS